MEHTDIDFICRKIVKKVEADWDEVIGVTGREGVGKSCCSAQIGKRMEKDGKFSLADNILFQPTHNEMKDKITSKKNQVIIADEAIRILYKLRWYEKAQIYMNTVYALARQENKISIFCMPRFLDFNEQMRNHRICTWVHVYRRGAAVVFVADENPFVSDPFWFKENLKVFDTAMRQAKTTKLQDEMIWRISDKIRGFLATFEFSDFTPEEKEEYKRLKAEYAYKGLEGEFEDVQETSAQQRNVCIFFLKVLKADSKDLAALMNVNIENVRSWAERGHTLLKSRNLTELATKDGYNTVIFNINREKNRRIRNLNLDSPSGQEDEHKKEKEDLNDKEKAAEPG